MSTNVENNTPVVDPEEMAAAEQADSSIARQL